MLFVLAAQNQIFRWSSHCSSFLSLYMSFQLVPNSVTLDDLEWRNSPYRRVISPNSVAFGTDCIKVVSDTPVLSAAEM